MAIKLSGLHLLLSYQCTLECDHCFTWGSPSQRGTMTITDIRRILQQARELGTITSIYFEGGEPFLYYALLLQAAREAAGLGFAVGIVSNAYWAHTSEDALLNLKPFAGLIRNLSVSSDLYHWSEPSASSPAMPPTQPPHSASRWGSSPSPNRKTELRPPLPGNCPAASRR